jgi:CBS domain-containing protein
MSPRAAWRLESLGFGEVSDYVAGEADWFASGLPREGRDTVIPRAGDVARRDVPTCGLSDRVGEGREQVQTNGWDACLVVNQERVVLGRLRGKALVADAETPVEQVMEAGPTTVRPDAKLAEVVERMRAKNVASVVVTTSDGRLVGLLTRADADFQGNDAEAGEGRTRQTG